MTRRLGTAAIAAALAILPFAALAAGGTTGTGDKAPVSATSAPGTDGGAEGMFKSLDRNGDGFLSKEEARGTPHEKDFATLDRDGDGRLSRGEHAAAPEHAGMAPATGKAAK